MVNGVVECSWLDCDHYTLGVVAAEVYCAKNAAFQNHRIVYSVIKRSVRDL